MEFDYDGGGLAKGGTVSLYLDGDKAGSGRVDATAAMIFSADDTLDIGEEGGALVTEDYGSDNAFSGKVNWVQIDLSTDDGDHMVTDDERVRVAMARQ
jgi:arylsulfatase